MVFDGIFLLLLFSVLIMTYLFLTKKFKNDIIKMTQNPILIRNIKSSKFLTTNLISIVSVTFLFAYIGLFNVTSTSELIQALQKSLINNTVITFIFVYMSIKIYQIIFSYILHVSDLEKGRTVIETFNQSRETFLTDRLKELKSI